MLFADLLTAITPITVRGDTLLEVRDISYDSRQVRAGGLFFALRGEASDGQEAIEAARKLLPDVVLMDISMPGMNGVHLHTALREDRRTKRIPFIWNSAYQELRELLPLSNTSLDYKFDKAGQLPEMLYLISHLAAARSLTGQDETPSRPADISIDTPAYS